MSGAYLSTDPAEFFTTIPHQAGSHNAPTGNCDWAYTGTDPDTGLAYRSVAWATLNLAKYDSDIYVGVKAEEVSAIEDDVVFTVDMYNAVGAMTLEVEFLAHGNMLSFVEVVGVNDWRLIGDIEWTTTGASNVWKGTATLGYYGFSLDGFTTKKIDEVAKFVFEPKALGNTTFKLLNAKVNVLDGANMVAAATNLGADEAMTLIDQTVYNKYDLNKDNKVSSLDLAICLLYVEFRSVDTNWATYTKVNDSKGKPVFANMCDFDGNGVVNMVDLIDLMLHYS